MQSHVFVYMKLYLRSYCMAESSKSIINQEAAEFLYVYSVILLWIFILGSEINSTTTLQWNSLWHLYYGSWFECFPRVSAEYFIPYIYEIV